MGKSRAEMGCVSGTRLSYCGFESLMERNQWPGQKMGGDTGNRESIDLHAQMLKVSLLVNERPLEGFSLSVTTLSCRKITE